MTAIPFELHYDLDTPPALLSYQQELLSTTADVVVYEKSRRIGISWAGASAAVTTSAAARIAGGMDTYYVGYNLDMARGFIDDCAFWSKWLGAFAGALPGVDEFLFEDGDDEGKAETRYIKAFRITYASGYQIVALSSRPRSLRSKQGFVIIDEAAFHDDLPGMIKAALALLMWGGRVWIISTHDGADNPFNELVEECRANKAEFKLIRTTFDDALRDGLYERIKLTAPPGVTIAPKEEWIRKIRTYYRDDAAEELDVIPSQGSGVWLTRALIKRCMNPELKVAYLKCEDGFAYLSKDLRESFIDAWLEDHVAPLLAQLDPECRSYLGGDFARTGDLTVFMPGQVKATKLRVPFSIELRNVPFSEQKRILHWVIDRLPHFTHAALDARGLGAQLAEETAQKYGASRVTEVKATQDWYRVSAPPLKSRFEDVSIEMPEDEDLIKDLRAVKVNKGIPMVADNMRATETERGQRHGDAAIALMMLESAAASALAPAAGATTEPDHVPDEPEPDGLGEEPAARRPLLERPFAGGIFGRG